MMKFLRQFGGAKALALAASELALDETSGGARADDEIKPVDGVVVEGDGSGEPLPPVADEVVEVVAAEQPQADAPAADDQAALAAGRAEMHDRITAVFASEHVTGREAAAAELLAADLASDKIIATLAKLPAGGTPAGNAMLDAIREASAGAPPAPAASETDEAKKPSAVWQRAHDKLGFNNK